MKLQALRLQIRGQSQFPVLSTTVQQLQASLSLKNCHLAKKKAMKLSYFHMHRKLKGKEREKEKEKRDSHPVCLE